MTNESLGLSYLRKVRVRIKALHVLAAEEGHSDVVRECQEAYELLLKAVLRFVAIDPPKWHDVGPILKENAAKLPNGLRLELGRITAASTALRKERELAFYGAEDFLPDENYTSADSAKWIAEVEWLFSTVQREFRIDPL